VSDSDSISSHSQGAIDTSPETFERYLAEDDGGPVTIMNLVRYADEGRELYQEYIAQVAKLMADVGGEILYAGDFSSPLIPGDPGGWDGVVLARYRDRAGLFKVSQDPRFPAINRLRHRALSATLVEAVVGW